MSKQAATEGDSRAGPNDLAQPGKPTAASRGIIALHLRHLGQLFDPFVPSPFRERDLDR